MTLIRDKVLHKIRRDILSCELSPGEPLRETELAQRYMVSKAPVRDALHRLKFEGLIETEPRRGHRVAPISVGDAQDILEMRETLEVYAAKRIVTDVTSSELEGLDFWRSADVSNVRSFADYNRRFHLGLAVLSRNDRMVQEMRRLLDAYERLCIVSLEKLRSDEGDIQTALTDHNLLIDALQSRDQRAAIKIIRVHIKKSKLNIMKGLKNRSIIE